MTAEVLLMNRTAVAMAADSAVSTQYGIGQSTKVYLEARKLLALSRDYPVGMMFSSSPDFHGLPWEVVVGEFRATERPVQPTVEAHADEFLDFLERESARWVDSPTHDEAVTALVQVVLDDVRERWKTLRDKRPDTNDEAKREEGKRETAAQAVQNLVNDWNRQPERPSCMEPDEAEMICGSAIDELLKRNDAFVRHLTPDARSALRTRLVDEVRCIGPVDRTDIVVAGFGADELFPAAVEISVGPRLPDRLRAAKSRRWAIAPAQPAVVVPFAERSVIEMFLRGLSTEFRTAIAVLIAKLMAPTAEQDEQLELTARAERSLDELADRTWPDVAVAVSFLPKAGLADLARELIEMTSLRQRMTIAPETVGGPPDVAVISRGEGFVWVQRNHYFPAELNPGFFDRYHGRQ